ncbi:RNA-binding domain-containing protein [Leptotrichia sp. oral taxon 879]|uniref:ATP-binding protein n=1 Tax=Leptotrichia sp. oral taxon 879 TaxID=1227267 RepID=UPI0003AE61C8|nr:RNA-binding domain-containing protein [Leptotrichia sp. oral taxon 879]ERK54995.1 divergent AAA domain protein [Leptotrichia sp. oral taxon 879 str. F0557]
MLIEEILKGESEKTEFKENAKTNTYIKTVVAFANGNGGKIVFGVKDNKEIVGVENEFEVMDGIINAISDSCYPMIMPDISLHTLENKTVILVEIEGGKKKPYYLKSKGMQKGTYIRSGATTRIIEEDYVLKELVLEGENKYFDQQVCHGESVSDEEIEKFCEWLEKLARKNSENDTEIRKITRNTLLSWKVLEEKNGRIFPTNAYILLSGKGNWEVSRKIQCGVFKGETRSIFVDKKEFEGSIIMQLEKAYQYVLEKINLGSDIVGIYRVDKYEIPPKSIREVIANAVIHRSYLEPNDIQVALYDNRLEITSPGMLLSGVNVKRMKEGYSKLRNRAIASVFAYVNIIEKWGSGIPRIMNEIREYGLQEPEFIIFENDFRVNIYRKNYNTTQSTQGSTQNRINTTQDISKKEKLDIKNLTETDKTIINTIINNPEMSQKQIADNLNWTVNKVKYYMKKFKQKNILKYEGTSQNGKWEIQEENLKYFLK